MRKSPDSSDLGPTIERCPHDRENPYAMVSRALIRDSSISPNCRMILIFLLSNDARKWVIRVHQVWHAFDEYLGRDKTYNLINEAIEAGYMRKEEYFQGNLKRCKYYISEEPKFKKCYRRPDFQDPEHQDPEHQDPDHRDPENKDVLERQSSQERTSEETTTKKKEQAAPVAAVSFDKDGEKKKEPSKPKIYECLHIYDDNELPLKEKTWITKHHDEETVYNAILWAQNETSPFHKGLAAALKWACSEKPQIAKNAVDQKEANRSYAMKYNRMEASGVKIDCCSASVNFEWITPCPTPCFCLEYDAKGFLDQFQQKLIQRKFPILEWK